MLVAASLGAVEAVINWVELGLSWVEVELKLKLGLIFDNYIWHITTLWHITTSLHTTYILHVTYYTLHMPYISTWKYRNIKYEHLVVHNNNTNFVQGSINILTIYIKYTTIG